MDNTHFNEEEAGKYLGGQESPISARTLQRWRADGTGPRFVRVGRLVRYRRCDLDVWLSARVFTSTSERIEGQD